MNGVSQHKSLWHFAILFCVCLRKKNIVKIWIVWETCLERAKPILSPFCKQCGNKCVHGPATESSLVTSLSVKCIVHEKEKAVTIVYRRSGFLGMDNKMMNLVMEAVRKLYFWLRNDFAIRINWNIEEKALIMSIFKLLSFEIKVVPI